MTEAQWLACTDPQPMLDFLRGKTSERKLRLFACACWRRLEKISARRKRLRFSIQAGERFSDGIATPEETAAANLALMAGNEHKSLAISGDAYDYALFAANCIADRFGYHAAETMLQGGISSYIVYCGVTAANEKKLQAAIIHCIFGPLHFRPLPTLDASYLAWNDTVIPKLAQAIYDNRSFQNLPILGDALEESGCTDAPILSHLRGPGPHVRGCWALDLTLGLS